MLAAMPPHGPRHFYDVNKEYWNAVSDDDSISSSLSDVTVNYTTEDIDIHSEESENETDPYDKFRFACNQRRKKKDELDNVRQKFAVYIESDTDDPSQPHAPPRPRKPRTKSSRVKMINNPVVNHFEPLQNNADSSALELKSEQHRIWTDSGISLSRTDHSRTGTLHDELRVHQTRLGSPNKTSSTAAHDGGFHRAVKQHVDAFGYGDEPESPNGQFIRHLRENFGASKEQSPHQSVDSFQAKQNKPSKVDGSQNNDLVDCPPVATYFSNDISPNDRTTRLLSKISKLLETNSTNDLTSDMPASTSPSSYSISQSLHGSHSSPTSPEARRSQRIALSEKVGKTSVKQRSFDEEFVAREGEEIVRPLSAISLTELFRSSQVGLEKHEAPGSKAIDERPISPPESKSKRKSNKPKSAKRKSNNNSSSNSRKSSVNKDSESVGTPSSVSVLSREEYSSASQTTALSGSSEGGSTKSNHSRKTRDKNMSSHRKLCRADDVHSIASDTTGAVISTDVGQKPKTKVKQNNESPQRKESVSKEREILEQVMKSARDQVNTGHVLQEPRQKIQTSQNTSNYPRAGVYPVDKYLANHNQAQRKKSSGFFGGLRKMSGAMRPRFFGHKQPKDCSSEFMFTKVDHSDDAASSVVCHGDTADTWSVTTEETIRDQNRLSMISSECTVVDENDDGASEMKENIAPDDVLDHLSQKPIKKNRLSLSRFFWKSRSYSAERLASKKGEHRNTREFERSKRSRVSTHSIPDNFGRRKHRNVRRVRSRSLEDVRSSNSAHSANKTHNSVRQTPNTRRDSVQSSTSSQHSREARSEPVHSSVCRSVSRSLTDIYTTHDYESIEDVRLREMARRRAGSEPNTPSIYTPMLHPPSLCRLPDSESMDCECPECLYQEYLQFLWFRQTIRQQRGIPCSCSHQKIASSQCSTPVQHMSPEHYLLPMEMSPIFFQPQTPTESSTNNLTNFETHYQHPQNAHTRYQDPRSPAMPAIPRSGSVGSASASKPYRMHHSRSHDRIPYSSQRGEDCVPYSSQRGEDCVAPLIVQDAPEKAAVNMKTSMYDTFV